MSAFDYLVASLAPRRQRQALDAGSPPVASGAVNRTEVMRQYLQRHGPANSATLALEADLGNTGLVSALLKADIDRGSVYRDGNKWAWNDEWSAAREQALRRASALLRRAGYVVTRKAG